jgi:hypothetical protein
MQTANSDSNDCFRNRPFYWEVGDSNGRLVGGSVNSNTDPTVYAADTEMPIASGSKWLYASYVLERTDGSLSDDDIRHLTLRSGYTSFAVCLARQTVGQCASFANNGVYTPEHDGLFYYGGGHMQQHATLLGLSDLSTAALAQELRSQLGTEIELSYALPELAGGASTSPGEYAKFLRKLLANELRMGSMLGTHAVCASPETCPDEAVSTASPAGETWHYSLGHWVEDDPVVGDGAFSSLGILGFYPWIDSTATWYGVVAKQQLTSVLRSFECGRLIRRAWLTAEPQ